MRKILFSGYPEIRDRAVKNRQNISHTGDVLHTGFVVFWSGILLLLIVTLGASAYSTPESIVAAGNVYVSNVTYNPGSFFTNDAGTAMVYVTNGNSDQSVVVNHATISGDDIRLTSRPYDSSANIGPLQTQSFTFSVVADPLDGTYYPTFSLSFRDADSLYYKAMVQVDNTPVMLTILDKPDTFTQGRKDSVNIQIANPRKNSMKNVILEVSGDGISTLPSKSYIGTLSAGAYTNVTVSVTPDQQTTLKITVNYDNGDNHHTVALDLPVTFGTDKKQASLQMSNVKATLEGTTYHITGDVTNAGLENANGVTVTALTPAVPQDPYKVYVMGALKPDDFGSFEVTFSANGVKNVPLEMSYKDKDGNVVTSQHDVSIDVTDSSQTQSQSSLLPVIGVIIAVACVGGYLYVKRRKTL